MVSREQRRGSVPVEYAMIAALVSVFIIGAIVALGQSVEAQHVFVADQINNAMGS